MRTRKEEKVLGDFCNGKHNNIQIIHDSRHMLRYLDLDQSRRERKRERERNTLKFGQTNFTLRCARTKLTEKKWANIYFWRRFTGKYA